MSQIEILPLRGHPEWWEAAAGWFSGKWGVPREEYRRSMAEAQRTRAAVPRWYLALDGARIAGGIGVIENDFHPRRDLRPNVCALFVEPPYRGRGLAGALLQTVCREMQALGEPTLYLLTDHTRFYERYGWQYLCTVQADGDPAPCRVYVHTEN